MKKKLVYVGFAFGHHIKTHSGYHQIKNYINYDIIIDGQKDYDFVFNKIERLPNFLKEYYRRYFGWRLWFTELRCIIRALFFKNQIFHIIYGENILKNLGRFKGKSNKIVCTYHQTFDMFKKNEEWLTSAKYVDKIILVSKIDIERFRKVNNNTIVKFIPHGVNTKYYTPANSKREKSVLMVGNWQRDFTFANQVFKKILEENNDIKIDIVTNKNNYIFFDTHPRIYLRSAISDKKLKCLYQKAGVVFFPLIEFTANNAILEAASCGADIIIATYNKNYSYFNERSVTFIDLDIKLSASTILHKLIENKKTDNYKNREFVIKQYSWERIANITCDFLYNGFDL